MQHSKGTAYNFAMVYTHITTNQLADNELITTDITCGNRWLQGHNLIRLLTVELTFDALHFSANNPS